jgi:hypothetical protein
MKVSVGAFGYFWALHKLLVSDLTRQEEATITRPDIKSSTQPNMLIKKGK